MSDVARGLLLKLLAQADRGGRPTLPVNERSAREYFDLDLSGRDAAHAFLENAEADGGVTLDRGAGAASQDLIRLRIGDPDRLSRWLGVPRADALAERIDRQLTPLIADGPDWLQGAYAEALAQWRRGGAAFRIPSSDPTAATGLFRVACAVAAGEQRDLDLRRFSVRLLNDSKAVERLLGRLAGLLRRNPDWAHLDEDADLFRTLGLEKFPPPLFLKGPLVIASTGAEWDIASLRPFIGISPDSIDGLRTSAKVPYLLTIENLASFQRHVREVRDLGVVLYTAGFPAPALVGVLGLLDDCLPNGCPFFHWGDRDAGGLRIYAKIATACPRHPVRPHLMDKPLCTDRAFTRIEIVRLNQIAAKKNSAGELARKWLGAELGASEQEAMDPRAPTRVG